MSPRRAAGGGRRRRGAGDGVRRGKTNPEGEARDVRFVKGDVAGALRMLRAAAARGVLEVAGVPEMHHLHDAGEHEGGHLEVVEPAGRAEGVGDHRLELSRRCERSACGSGSGRLRCRCRCRARRLTVRTSRRPPRGHCRTWFARDVRTSTSSSRCRSPPPVRQCIVSPPPPSSSRPASSASVSTMPT